MSATEKNGWSARGHVMFGFLGLLFLVGGFGTWAVQTQISGAIISPGRIEVDRNRQVVQHETGGTVDQIMVDEGDTVAAGDLLIQLDAQTLTSQLTIVEGQLFEFMARRGRLIAERDDAEEVSFDPELIEAGTNRSEVRELVAGQRNLFVARRLSVAQSIDQLGKRRSQIESQIVGVEAQEEAIGAQLALIEQELSNQQTLLDRGLAQAGTVLNLQRQLAGLQGSLGELAATKAQSEGRITEIELEILNLGTVAREEAITRLRDLRSRELELSEQRRALMHDIDQLAVRAPVSGIVYSLQVQTPRSVVRPAEPLMYLVPQDRPLVIVARVEPIHIDQITVGQQVNLRLSALDQRTTPELIGEVSQISADSLEDQVTAQSYYRAEIILKQGEVERLGSEATLLPGMPVEAFIRTGDRSPMAYLVKPMADYFARAFRES